MARMLGLFWNYWTEAAEKNLLETTPRSIDSSFWWGMKRQGRHSETMRTRADIVWLLGNSVDKDENALTQTQSCQNSGVNNIVPTHIMLLSTDSAASSPSVSSSCRFYGQQHVQITRRHNFDCHPAIGLLLSRAPCRLLGLSRDMLCCSTWVVCWIPLNGDKFSCTVKTEWIRKPKKPKLFVE